MARFVHPHVEDAIDNPTPGTDAMLALVLEENTVSEVQERVREYDGVFVDELSSGVVVVRVKETKIEGFCEPNWIKSVTFTDEMKILT